MSGENLKLENDLFIIVTHHRVNEFPGGKERSYVLQSLKASTAKLMPKVPVTEFKLITGEEVSNLLYYEQTG